MKSLKCQLHPHRLNTSHIYNIYLRTVHRGLASLGQVKDCSLEFLCSLDRLGPIRTVQVLLSWSGFVRDWPPLASRLCYRAFSVQNQCSIGCDMSRDEATHCTIGDFLTQNPFSHINFAFFKCYFLFNSLGH